MSRCLLLPDEEPTAGLTIPTTNTAAAITTPTAPSRLITRSSRLSKGSGRAGLRRRVESRSDVIAYASRRLGYIPWAQTSSMSRGFRPMPAPAADTLRASRGLWTGTGPTPHPGRDRRGHVLHEQRRIVALSGQPRATARIATEVLPPGPIPAP